MNRIIAIDPDQTHQYVPKIARDWPVEDQPVFILKALKAKDAARLEDGMADAVINKKENDNTTMRIYSGTAVINALKTGLVGWQNFKDVNGNDVIWRENNGVPRSENFDCIPAQIRKELAEAITEGNFLTEQEEKNSE